MFSFAMILHEMGTRTRPLRNYDGRDILDFYQDDDPFRPAFPRHSRITQSMVRLIRRCWDNDPEYRPDFEEIFDEFATGRVAFTGTDSETIKRMVKKIGENERQLDSMDNDLSLVRLPQRRITKGTNEAYPEKKEKKRVKEELKKEKYKREKRGKERRVPDDQRDVRRNCDSSNVIDWNVLGDWTCISFKNELGKVGVRDASRFFKLIVDHLRGSKTPAITLRWLFAKCAEIIDNPERAREFCDRGVSQVLPLREDECCDVIYDVIEKLFIYSPESLQSNFKFVMLQVVNTNPARAVVFMKLYVDVFDEMEDPWTIVDLLVTEWEQFDRGKVGHRVIALLVTLVAKFDYYKQERLLSVLDVLISFTMSKHRKTAVVAYKNLLSLYNGKFAIDAAVLEQGIRDDELRVFVLAILKKSVSFSLAERVVYALLKAARTDSQAKRIILKFLDINVAKMLLSYTRYMRYGMPTYSDTLQVVYQLSGFDELRNEMKKCMEIPSLLERAAGEGRRESFIAIGRVSRRIRFGVEFLHELNRGTFFTELVRGMENDDDVTVACLTAISAMARRECVSGFRQFVNVIIKLLEQHNDAVGEAALKAAIELCKHDLLRDRFSKGADMMSLAQSFTSGPMNDLAEELMEIFASD